MIEQGDIVPPADRSAIDPGQRDPAAVIRQPHLDLARRGQGCRGFKRRPPCAWRSFSRSRGSGMPISMLLLRRRAVPLVRRRRAALVSAEPGQMKWSGRRGADLFCRPRPRWRTCAPIHLSEETVQNQGIVVVAVTADTHTQEPDYLGTLSQFRTVP